MIFVPLFFIFSIAFYIPSCPCPCPWSLFLSLSLSISPILSLLLFRNEALRLESGKKSWRSRLGRVIEYMQDHLQEPLRLEDFAREAGTNLRTLRYYEELGLLQAAQRSQGGFRYYRRTDVNRLNLIRDLQDLGLSLDRIRELRATRDAGDNRGAFFQQVRAALADTRPAEKPHAHQKYWQELLGQVGGRVRAPMLELTDAEKAATRAAFERCGLQT